MERFESRPKIEVDFDAFDCLDRHHLSSRDEDVHDDVHDGDDDDDNVSMFRCARGWIATKTTKTFNGVSWE
jgi:hypothetical protein